MILFIASAKPWSNLAIVTKLAHTELPYKQVKQGWGRPHITAEQSGFHIVSVTETGNNP